jgi:hypothetical protein
MEIYVAVTLGLVCLCILTAIALIGADDARSGVTHQKTKPPTRPWGVE